MNNDFREQIYNEINLRDTDNLLDIWRGNNRVEWSDVAFEIIGEILKKRGVEIPQQDAPVYEYKDIEKTEDVEDYSFSDEELKIVDNENQPKFYDPFEVLRFSKWIDLMARVMIGLTIIQGFMGFSRSQNIVQGFFIRQPDSTLILPITVLLVVVDIVVGILLVYVPLKALSRILHILMEMEFNSRKGKQPNSLIE